MSNAIALDLVIFGVCIGLPCGLLLAIALLMLKNMLTPRKPLERDWTDYP